MLPRAFLLLFGFSLFLLADILTFYGTAGFVSAHAFDSDTYLASTLLVRIAVFLLIFFLLSSKRNSVFPSRSTNVFGALCISVGICLIFALGGVVGEKELMVLSGSLIGAGQALLYLTWLSSLSLFGYRASYLFLLGCHALATLLCVAVLALVPGFFRVALVVVSVWVSAFCAPRQESLPHVRSVVGEHAVDMAPLLSKGVLTVGVFAAIGGFVTSISPKIIDPIDLQYITLLVSSVVLVVMFVPALAFEQPLKLENSYRIALPLSALGFLVLPGMIEGVPVDVAGTLATTGYMVCGIVLYCLIAEISNAASVSPVLLFAACEAIVLVCRLFGMVVGEVCSALVPNMDVALAPLGVGCLYLVVIAVSWLAGRGGKGADSLPSESAPDERSDDFGEPAENARAQVCEASDLGFMSNLSQDQVAICIQMLEGRTISRIAQDMFLSSSAVKYHAQKIYRAAGVHSRSELAEKLRSCSQACDSSETLSEREKEAAASLGSARCADFDSNSFRRMTGHLASESGLSGREAQILDCLARGYSVGAIADALGISLNTAKTHVRHVYGKLGVHSKQEVIDLYRQRDSEGVGEADGMVCSSGALRKAQDTEEEPYGASSA